MDLIDKINKLKKEKNAIILTHCYQNVEIDEVSDYVGDSLFLSEKAAMTDADIILFAGVYFMAQSAKLLSPNKKVLLPEINSGCMMADMINVDNLKSFKERYPNIPVVCYINSTAEVKALCDVCCTSSNAIEVVKNLNSDKVLFVPDNFLGKYVQQQLPEIEIITFNGFCPIHQRIRLEEVEAARKNYPNALILAHPECNQEVAKNSDFIGSTKEIMEYVISSDARQFVIATEKGVVDRLNRDSKKFNWGKEFILINENIICPDMKKNTLEGIYNTLLNESNEITIDDEVAKNAVKCIDKMFEITRAYDLKKVICPLCSHEMKKVFVDEINANIDVCEECGGVFFDYGEFEHIEFALENNTKCIDEIDSCEAKTPYKNVFVDNLTCPSCQSKMVKIEKRGTTILECEACLSKISVLPQIKEYRQKYIDDEVFINSVVNDSEIIDALDLLFG
ncbi:MAG: quinolinate synthase NadA [Candidatus Gastranaerophilales bacterium]|nr:quinolinate synthase NadA [Candidatus Gastranaerophilales bacterium]